ncbi:hypothetical protein DFP72DRAFT_877616 [Ephemerocybe angulata]|uniref:Secreted protein n=1 Tax=Ephemerocybe angulata TaxID=980116 RepID=A0A8H6ICI2_9AGAR|nr:hypothetical protein DFP72DRAFT_877616 [Tulosesus angulatus]
MACITEWRCPRTMLLLSIFALEALGRGFGNGGIASVCLFTSFRHAVGPCRTPLQLLVTWSRYLSFSPSFDRRQGASEQ